MSRQNFVAPKLPKELRDKVEAGGTSSSKRRKSLPRKEQRKLERQQKKQVRRIHNKPNHRNQQHDADDSEDEEVIADPWADEDSDAQLDSTPPRKKVRLSPPATSKAEPAQPKKVVEKEIERTVKPRPSKAVRDALDDDDAEIAFLEKKLGIRGKKRSKNADQDGLGDLLDGIDDAVSGDQRSSTEDKEWLMAKRRRLDHAESSEDGDDIQSDQDDEVDELDGPGVDDEVAEFDFSDEDEDIEDPFGGSESDEPKQERPLRENPYRAPVPAASSASTQKYIPPSLRAPAKDDQEQLQRLQRQLQGLLNRLSEANILSIIKEVEVILANNARQHVISTLIDLLINLVADRSSHLDTFIVLHAGFIAGLYGSIGTHFGAEMLKRVVEEFQRYYEEQTTLRTGSKETSNLIALIAELYTFQIVGHRIIFDLIRLLLSDLSELNVELLLKVMRNCGVQLRADDPLALKDVVKLVHDAVARKGGEKQVPVRTRFMIETISNLKNNKLRTSAPGLDAAPQHALRLKKVIRSRSARPLEPLGISLKDIENAENGGKWWLVGASWNNQTTDIENDNDNAHDDGDVVDASEDLLVLAKHHRMNTDTRRTIFVTIMSSVDYKDAWLKLRRLRLKKAQQFEIPRIIVYLAGAEENYNPFYRLVAKEMCSEHKYRKALTFNLWRIWSRWGERDDMADEGDLDGAGDEYGNEEVQLREVVSLAKFYGELIADQSLPITVLKTLDFMHLQEKTQTFVEILLVTVLQSVIGHYKSRQNEASARIMDIFNVAKQAPQMVPGLQYFLRKRVKRSSLVVERSQKLFEMCCRTAIETTNLAESVDVAE